MPQRGIVHVKPMLPGCHPVACCPWAGAGPRSCGAHDCGRSNARGLVSRPVVAPTHPPKHEQQEQGQGLQEQGRGSRRQRPPSLAVVAARPSLVAPGPLQVLHGAAANNNDVDAGSGSSELGTAAEGAGVLAHETARHAARRMHRAGRQRGCATSSCVRDPDGSACRAAHSCTAYRGL